ncbi:unnamed protein product [Boreogadus saida]
MDRRLRLETRGLQHRTRGEPQMQENVFLERRRAGRGAVNLEDDITLPTRILRPDQESGGLMEKPYIWKANPEDNQDSTIKDSSSSEPRPPEDLLRRAGRGAVNLEDDITLPTRILRPDQESGGLMEKPYIWKANPEDNQDSTIKDSSHT